MMIDKLFYIIYDAMPFLPFSDYIVKKLLKANLLKNITCLLSKSFNITYSNRSIIACNFYYCKPVKYLLSVSDNVSNVIVQDCNFKTYGKI